MQILIRTLFLLTLLLNSFRLFAQNGPPTVEQVRGYMDEDYRQTKVPLSEVYKTEARKIAVGADSVTIQIYYPTGRRNLPILYNVHGGAFIWSPGPDMNISRILCNRTQSIVVSVDYRLAPEHPFPTSINDAYAVWNWITANAQRLGGDPNRVSLVGDSAGGLFIAALQVKRQQEGKPARPLAMVFVNPGIDLREGAPGGGEYRLVSNMYLGGAAPNSPLASPILADNFGDYPPSLVIISEKDAIRQHGILLADKLKAAGRACQLVDLPGLDHLGPIWTAANPKAQSAIDATVNFLNTANTKRGK
ncbi:alpha/beta hydrolase [Fibrella forsythiae]|uniref:Alpha/beta hydrolase n=1 Tax=Fibrella forsythiae TaxID=2817061 RepID=A0ABS3JKY5_9BACT|nr:alpha/beta hydrolase [Fibrella forsythiae]MBO0950674.1 alpha/beta hydrolase [Fibrella forsythiae]